MELVNVICRDGSSQSVNIKKLCKASSWLGAEMKNRSISRVTVTPEGTLVLSLPEMENVNMLQNISTILQTKQVSYVEE
jgi:hypothetical protein